MQPQIHSEAGLHCGRPFRDDGGILARMEDADDQHTGFVLEVARKTVNPADQDTVDAKGP